MFNRIGYKYICKECGHQFRFTPIISNLIRMGQVLTDPAPTYGSLFKSAVCPKCGSKQLKKTN